MRTMLRLAVVLLAAAGLAAAAADPAYLGKWKMNPGMSDFGQMTVKYEALPGDQFKTTMDGQSYNFKMDASDAPTPWGTVASWKKINDTSWEVTQKVNNNVVGTDTITLAPDGNTMTVDSKMKNASGQETKHQMTFQRTSGGPGLAGTWKGAKVTSDSPSVLEITANGGDGLTLNFVDQGATCSGKFDNKDNPAAGPMWPAGWTCALMKGGERGFAVTWKKDGKPMYLSNYVVGTDPNVMTETSMASNTREKVKIVYEKQ